MQPWFIATERFSPASDGWAGFVAWSGLTHLEELVSLDGMLCAPILDQLLDTYWEHIVNEDFMLDYFVDLEFLRAELARPETSRKPRNLLAVVRNPPPHPVLPPLALPATWMGYDLCDNTSAVSALSNCGGFPLAFEGKELNRVGLIDTHARAVAIQARLAEAYPQEPHAKCHVWAIWRLTEPEPTAQI